MQQINNDDLTGEIDSLASQQIEVFEKMMYENVMYHQYEKDHFQANLNMYWWKGFIALEAMYHIILEMAERNRELTEEVREDGATTAPIKYFVLLNIHGRSCQQFLEILCLLKNGFADGAFARWRSLFELSVYAIFINQSNDEVAAAYLEQADSNENRAMWAKKSDCFESHKGNITFKDIFNKCEFSDDQKELWWNQYQLSSKTVHASAQGTMGRLANTGGKARVRNDDGTYKMLESFIPVGPSDWGLHIPAEHSAISFAQITTAFLLFKPSAENLLSAKTILKWVDVIRRHLYETVGTCFPEVEEAVEIYDNYLGICEAEKEVGAE